MRDDSQNAEILDYIYKSDSTIIASRPKQYVAKDIGSLQEGVTGKMIKGTSLYVKWRAIGSNAVYEETLDLRGILLDHLDGNIVYIMVRGPQLYLYLISPHVDGQENSKIGPSEYRYHSVKQLYPSR